MRSTSKEHYRPDLVLFVNGIPLCIIECKRPDMKEPLKQAISQHLRNQQDDGIRQLYVYSQLTLSLATQEASYATNGTKEKFWAKWQEKFDAKTEEKEYQKELFELKNKPLSTQQKDKMFADRFRYVRQHFDALEQDEIQITEQDKYLYGLCKPKRLLDIAFSFILFDNGAKKVARYQQFFAIKKTMKRIKTLQSSPSSDSSQREGSKKTVTYRANFEFSG